MSDFGKLMQEKCMNFSIRVVNLCRFLNEEKHEYNMANQLFRSGTSIGANYSESQSAISKRDFISKVYISSKECSESLYWLELLFRTKYITEQQYNSINADCLELKKMLTSITKTSRENELTPSSVDTCAATLKP